MYLHVLSDLHLESGAYRVPDDLNCDVIAAAGDLAEGTRGVEFLKALGRPVVYVPGNHEYYSPKGEIDMAERLAAIRKAASGSQVHVLEKNGVVLNGVRFLGTTLWTDFGNAHPGLLREALATQNDYRLIGAQSWFDSPENRAMFKEQGNGIWDEEYWATAMSQRRFHPIIALALHRQSRAWLEERLAEPFDGPTVVVTHHHPLYRSLVLSGTDPALVYDQTLWDRQSYSDDRPRYRVASYASELTDLFLRFRDRIAVWVAGHLHTHLDYAQFGVRVVCNPRGLAVSQPAPGDASSGALNRGRERGFNPWFTVDLDRLIRPVIEKEIEAHWPRLLRLHRESIEMAEHLPHDVAPIDQAVREAFAERTELFAITFDRLIRSVAESMGYRPIFPNKPGSWMTALGLPLPGKPLRFNPMPLPGLPPSFGVAEQVAGCLWAQKYCLGQLDDLPDRMEKRHKEKVGWCWQSPDYGAIDDPVALPVPTSRITRLTQWTGNIEGDPDAPLPREDDEP